MPIQIIDNFDLNVAKPIDNRFVVGSQSFYTTKEQIPWKYAGMRIWDLNDSTPYVWTGTTYSSENSVSITGVGTINPNYIAKFGSVNQITSSNIYDDGLNIIGTYQENSLHKSLKLEVPKNTKFIKIDDLHTLANIKQGINITKE